MCQLPQSVALCRPPPESFLNQLSGTGRWLGGPEGMREGVGLRALGSRKGRGMNRTLGGGPGPSPACLFSSALSPFASTANSQPPQTPYYGEFPSSSWGEAQGPGPSASHLSRGPSHGD